LRNLDAEASYIATDDPAPARLVVARVLAAVPTLVDQPGLGRPGRIPDTRELVVGKTRYIVPYRGRGEAVEILRVFQLLPRVRGDSRSVDSPVRSGSGDHGSPRLHMCSQ
jgi:plasmid stabilization system protein ParE